MVWLGLESWSDTFDILPVTKKLLTGSLPVSKELLTGRLPINNFNLKKKEKQVILSTEFLNLSKFLEIFEIDMEIAYILQLVCRVPVACPIMTLTQANSWL